jgi:hypothetical protein
MALTLADALRQTGYAQGGQLQAPAPTQPNLSTITNDYISQIPEKAAQNAINTNYMVQNAMPYDFATHSFQKGPTYEEFLNYAPNLMGATAWHGTPHKIQGAFDISKVGTGEGAQAYGHGMYFAENPAVAKQYADMDTDMAKIFLKTNNNDILKAIDDAEKHYDFVKQKFSPNQNTLEANQRTIDYLKNKWLKDQEISGNLYKVDIPDKHIPNMLDWDEKVPEDLRKRISAKTMEQFGNGATGTSGEHLYKEIVFEMRRNGSKNPEADASAWLTKQGVSGIRYLDEGSRGVSQKYVVNWPNFGGYDFDTLKEAKEFIKQHPKEKLELIEPKKTTSNFVVFEPSTVKILEENGKPLTRKEVIQQQIDKLE